MLTKVKTVFYNLDLSQYHYHACSNMFGDFLSLRKENNKWIAEYGYKTLIIDVLPKFPVKVIENACIVDEWERPENPWSYG